MPNYWTNLWATTTNAIAIATGVTPVTATTPPRGRDMPITRDAHGRFTSSHVKTPVTTVEEAAETLRHFTTIMNEVARANRLCSQFGISVTRAVADTPGVKFDVPNVPEFSMTWSIGGRVLTPVGADIVGPNSDVRRERASIFLREEFRAWARGHDLDPNKGSSWLAWVDTLPDDRKRHTATNTLGETGTQQYAEQTQEAARIVTFNLATEATEQTAPIEATPADTAKPEPEPERPRVQVFERGDRVLVLPSASELGSETHRLYSSAFNRGRDGDLIAEVVESRRGGEGYVVRSLSGYPSRTTQTVATADLRPTPATWTGSTTLAGDPYPLVTAPF